MKKEYPEEAALYNAPDRFGTIGGKSAYVRVPKPNENQSASGKVWKNHRDMDAQGSGYDTDE